MHILYGKSHKYSVEWKKPKLCFEVKIVVVLEQSGVDGSRRRGFRGHGNCVDLGAGNMVCSFSKTLLSNVIMCNFLCTEHNWTQDFLMVKSHLLETHQVS